MGEVFNGNPNYVSGYQGPLDATLNYPMYFKLKNAFQEKQTMRNIHDGVTQNSVFPDVSVLGNFLDNHDNPRFLSQNGDTVVLKNALAYIVFAEVSLSLYMALCVMCSCSLCASITYVSLLHYISFISTFYTELKELIYYIIYACMCVLRVGTHLDHIIVKLISP